MSSAGPTVAVVGMGFSGTAVAVHLARGLPRGSRLLLLEQGGLWARGLAYGSSCSSHWLNVPAGRLGLDPTHEAGFLEWLSAHQPGHQGGDFVPRDRLGDYLAHELDTALLLARRRGVQVQRQGTQVREMTREGGRWLLHLSDGSLREAAQVVLATGHGAPQAPRLPDVSWGEPGVWANPWAAGVLDGLPEQAELLILGTGLTAIDMVTALQDRGHTGRIHLLSRRGQLSRAHRALEARPPAGNWPWSQPGQINTPRQLLRQIRTRVAEAANQGHDWRDVMASLRSSTPALWESLGPRGQSQFLRHLVSWWDVHRHRMAPGIARRIEAQIASRQLSVAAGRLTAVAREAGGTLRVTWQPRQQGLHAEAPQSLRVAAILNCTGHSTSLLRAPHPLLQSLQETGWLSADALDLGLRVNDQFHPIGRDNRPAPQLRYVGPMLKARWWEAVAIPELRVHALAAARGVLADLSWRAGRSAAQPRAPALHD